MSNSEAEESQMLPTADKDTLMKQYQMMVDVHKFYFEIVLKFLVFHYAVTGAILSFYLSQPNVGVMHFPRLTLCHITHYAHSRVFGRMRFTFVYVAAKHGEQPILPTTMRR